MKPDENRDHVEFAIKLQNDVMCPIDSHWPIEKYKSIDEAFQEKVRSSNDFNYRVIVGPFENKSEMNNAREDFRILNMDSREIKNCKKVSDVSD